MPVVYRAEDSEGLLTRYAESQYRSFDELRERIRQLSDIRDPFLVRAEWSETTFLTLGKQIVPIGDVEQTGAQGRVFSLGIFTAQDRVTKFSNADVGKQLIIKRSSVPTNNQQTFIISSVLNDKEVATDPEIAIDAGPIRWELRPNVVLPEDEVWVEIRGGNPQVVNLGWSVFDGAQQFPVLTRQMYWQSVTNNQLLNEREDFDAEIDSAGTLGAASYYFQQTDVGKYLFAGPLPDGTSPLVEIYDVENGRAVFGRLVVPGALNDPFGKITYAYQTTADRLVTVQHVYEPLPNLPLQVTFEANALTNERFDITVRLATDAASVVTTIPSDIAAVVNVEPTISRYVEAYPTVTGTETPVGLLDRAPIKGRRLPETVDPVFWALRPFARMVLQGTVPLGLVEAENFDLQVLPDSLGDPLHPTFDTTRVFAQSFPFSEEDVGKLLTIHGSPEGNDGCYSITGVTPDGSRAFVRAFLREDLTLCYWERRSAPIIRSDPTRLNPLDFEVQGHARSMLDVLARDFGIEVDTRQVDNRQRAWVRQVSQWISIKGTEQSIIDVAHLSGFDVEVSQLFSYKAVAGIPNGSGNFFFIGDPGRDRTTGTITDAGFPVFSDPTQAFVAGDEGRVLHIGNSAAVAPSNTNYWVIEAVLSPTSVRLAQPSIGANLGPVTNSNFVEPNNGSLSSFVGQLYTTTTPSYILMDDADLDYVAVMADIMGRSATDRPGIDAGCDVHPLIVGSTSVDPDALSAGTGSQILSISSVGNVHTLTVQGDDLSVVIGGDWKLRDSAGNERFLDAPPVLVSLGAPVLVPYVDLNSIPQVATTYPNAIYTVQVSSTSPPVVGDVAFTYICVIVTDCDYCATYRLLIDVIAAEVQSEGPLANDNAFERVVENINDTLPIHVEPIYRFISSLETISPLLSSVEGSAEVVIPTDFSESFEFVGGWPGTLP
jgi:hypothetical protein